MPRPVYLICSTSGAIDQKSNRASYFEVIESFEVEPMHPSGEEKTTPKVLPSQSMRVVGVWLSNEDDTPDKVFDIQIVCTAPTGQEFFQSPVQSISFNKPFHRLCIPDVQLLGFPSLGVYEVESRLRRSGEEAWSIRQQFFFLVRPAQKSAPSDSKVGVVDEVKIKVQPPAAE